MKKHIKEIALIILMITITMLISIGIANAASNTESKDITFKDIVEIEGKGKNAIEGTLTYNLNKLQGAANTYCAQHGKKLNSNDKYYTVAKYVVIDGKTATVYGSKDSNGKTKVGDMNAKMAYVLAQKQGYGSLSNKTQGQYAVWSFMNEWVDLLGFGDSYQSDENDKVKVTGNTVVANAEKYANAIGDTTSKQAGKTLEITDKTTSSTELKKTKLEDGYYKIGPIKWKFSGDIKKVTVKADGSKLSEVKFLNKNNKEIDAKDISSDEKFYLKIKDAESIVNINFDVDLTEKTDVIVAHVWFLRSDYKYQNLIHVTTKSVPVNATGDGTFDYKVKEKPVKIGLVKVDDRGEQIPLDGFGFSFATKIKSYDLISSETAKHWVPDITYETDKNGNIKHDKNGNAIVKEDNSHNEDYTLNHYDWREHTVYLGDNREWGDSKGIFTTDAEGEISASGTLSIKTEAKDDGGYGNNKTEYAYFVDDNITATEEIIPDKHAGYENEKGKTYTISRNNASKQVIYMQNHQKWVDLSGYVWINATQGKTSTQNDVHDDNESGLNGVKVYLKDRSGNIVLNKDGARCETTTASLNIYSEIKDGQYIFRRIDLDKLQQGEYHVEYEYNGMRYKAIDAINLNKTTGSKAKEYEITRNILNNKFQTVNGNGTQKLTQGDISIEYGGIGKEENYVSKLPNSFYDATYPNANVVSSTSEANYNIYDDFEPTMEEIRYINLGLEEIQQTSYEISKDLYNVRVEVNGKSHIYRYGTTRYNDNGEVDENSSWNVGVKFQNNRGTYSRAIYKADAEWETAQKDKELKVYLTYKIAMKNASVYKGRINKLLDYSDSRMKLINAGKTIDADKDVVGNTISFTDTQQNVNGYNKYEINPDTEIEAGDSQYIYVQFELNREAVLQIMNNNELLNNVIEIDSYTTYKDGKVIAVLDDDSVPGNAIPGKIDTYEDDTDAARSLKLEVANARALSGTIFLDSTGKGEDTVEGQERIGNGKYNTNDGDKLLTSEEERKNITVELFDLDTNSVAQIYDDNKKQFVPATSGIDANGAYNFEGIKAGNYVVRYTWGNNIYKVQYYKGTIYNKERYAKTTTDAFWYRGSDYGNDTTSSGEIWTDAIDDLGIRKDIDTEMYNITNNQLENEIKKAYNGGSDKITKTQMVSTTPKMDLSIEYKTTITNGNENEVMFNVGNVNFGIVERPKQKLQLSKEISGYKIKLANGQILVDATIKDGKITGTKPYTTYLPNTTNQNTPKSQIGLLRTEMDNELIEGATLETTYTITAKNVGELDYTNKDYYLYGNKDENYIVKISVAQLLDYMDGRVQIVDESKNWNDVSSDQDYANKWFISKKDDSEYMNSIKPYVTTILKEAIKPTEQRSVTLQTSKLLTSTDDNLFNNQSEITEVKKVTHDGSDGRSGTPVKMTWDNSTHFNTANSEQITIIPSTGENRNYVIPTIITITAIVILGVGVFFIKKFVIDKNK